MSADEVALRPFNSNLCFHHSRDQNGRPIPAPRKEEPQQSHLLDLLDISLGATSISSPPLGAAAVVDPWAAPPARAASQLSDPWAGNSQPQADPWQTSAAPPRTIMSTGVPLGAVASAQPLGTPNDAWGLRAHSPSMASGSSNEGWLQTNGNANQNGGRAAAAAAPVDAWLTKTTVGPGLAAPAPAPRVATNGSSADPWLAEAQPVVPAAAAATSADPWAAQQPPTAALDDPWKALQAGAVKVCSFKQHPSRFTDHMSLNSCYRNNRPTLMSST